MTISCFCAQPIILTSVYATTPSVYTYRLLNDSPILEPPAGYILVSNLFLNIKSEFMKKIFLVTGIVVATAFTTAFAQYNTDDNNAKEGGETNQDVVSESVMNQFTSDFPHASNIDFEKTKDFNKVNFNQDGSQITAYYDNNNQLVGSTIRVSFHDLPVGAQIKILDKYRDYKVTDVLKYNVNSDNESYYDNDRYLDLYGNSIDRSSNYFVELKGENNAIVLEVDLSGEVSFFTMIK
jgi:hypothetical protein